MVKQSAGWLQLLLSVFLLVFLPTPLMGGQEGEYGQVPVKIAVEELPTFFSPYADSPLELQYAHLFFDPLVRWDKKQQLEKCLVQDWESLGGGVTRFYLKRNIKFHSGNPLYSNDVTWSFLQAVKVAHGRRNFEGITAIKPVGPYSFDVYSSLSQAQLLDYFSHFFVLDSKFYQAHRIDHHKPQDIVTASQQHLSISGTGPYTIKKYNPALHLDVVANKDYWQNHPAAYELNFIKIKSPDSRTFALLANDVDISESVSRSMLDTLDSVGSKSVIELPSANVMLLTINDKKSPVFKQEKVREAINLAINKEGMLKHILSGMGRVASVYTPLNQEAVKLPVYDIDKAQLLLNNVEMPAELTLLMLSEQMENTTEISMALVNMIKKLGINLLVTEVQDIEEWNKNLFDYDFTLSLWHSPLINSDNIYHNLFVDSALSSYFSAVFHQENLGYSIEKQITFFKKMQGSYQITPLLMQSRIWATDKRFNLSDIFSVNGIPYWHLLAQS